jgi:hypothetical protein
MKVEIWKDSCGLWAAKIPGVEYVAYFASEALAQSHARDIIAKQEKVAQKPKYRVSGVPYEVEAESFAEKQRNVPFGMRVK